MNRAKAKGGILVGSIGLAILAVPFALFFYFGYWAWDSQFEGNPYKIVFEKDGKLYEFGGFHERSVAFDKGTGDDQLYLNTFGGLSNLIAVGYGDYKIEKSDNPFFAGKTSVPNAGNYFDTEQKYTSPTESYNIFIFYDQNGKPIFTYQPETENEFVSKLRPTFPMFSKNKSTIGTKRDYLNVTKILKAKFDKNLKIRTDEANKLLILSLQ